jgi:ABC-type nitrate/sulfonate/bicarbonate transport system substrate-binding protein
VTHEYTIAIGGLVGSRAQDRNDAKVTAIAWAADRVLAVGSDDAVRSISRGDSTFLDLGGCVVTAIPRDLERAGAVVPEGPPDDAAIGWWLIDAGLLDADAVLEPGSPADLAFWVIGAAPTPDRGPGPPGLIAVVRGGRFTEGDERRGPFPAPP